MKTKHIALLSDFGTHDPFVGAMKGVLLSKAPGLTIIDITHQIPPQDIQTAAFYLMAATPYMPKGTLFMCVVDPTVGTGRGIVWARTENHQFIAPDNGLISWVDQKERIVEAREAGLINPQEAIQLERDYMLRRKVIMVDDFDARQLQANG